MRQKKAKELRRYARKIVEAWGKPTHEIAFWYKKLKQSYKRKKGQL